MIGWGEIYKIHYKGHEIEGSYIGPNGSQRYLVLININPRSRNLPVHFPIISIKDLKLEGNELLYPDFLNRIRKIKLSKLEQEHFNSLGKKYWEQKVL